MVFISSSMNLRMKVNITEEHQNIYIRFLYSVIFVDRLDYIHRSGRLRCEMRCTSG